MAETENFYAPSLLTPCQKPARATHDAKAEYIRVATLNAKKLIECGLRHNLLIEEIEAKQY